MTLLQAVREFFSSAFGHGMVKVIDIAGTYDVRSGSSRPAMRNADDLPTPTVHDDITHMREDFGRVSGDMRRALKKHPSFAK
ncbi:MAG: hypothetical protein EOO61_05005 [Hymenobacter sp.]|nr:MAG: hypothetical protein EOO61_05005 [Hymenobacter sp.]